MIHHATVDEIPAIFSETYVGLGRAEYDREAMTANWQGIVERGEGGVLVAKENGKYLAGILWTVSPITMQPTKTALDIIGWWTIPTAKGWRAGLKVLDHAMTMLEGHVDHICISTDRQSDPRLIWYLTMKGFSPGDITYVK